MQAWEVGGAILKIQTSTDRVTWTDEAWTVTTTTRDIGPGAIDTTLVHNLGSETTFVAFVISGDLYYFDYWYIDDVGIDRAGNAKVDFNKDGHEDILWRTMGTGRAKAMNVVWFMDQPDSHCRCSPQQAQLASRKGQPSHADRSPVDAYADHRWTSESPEMSTRQRL